jgi:uncharacterized membrane protein YcaP (DUF421 family)
MNYLEAFDFKRIFIGNAPPIFLLEIAFRTVIMYSYTIFLLRFLGKRGMGQLSSLEVAIIICFGSAVGDPMMQFEVPLLHGIAAVTTIAIIQVWMERIINKHKKLEEIMEGKAECIVDDGIINMEILRKNNLSHEDLFRSLRNNEVEHLGQIKRAFFETSGQLSVMFHSPKHIKAGLSVMPSDMIPENAIQRVPQLVIDSGIYSCMNCGNSRQYEKDQNFESCKICDSEEWLRFKMRD